MQRSDEFAQELRQRQLSPSAVRQRRCARDAVIATSANASRFKLPERSRYIPTSYAFEGVFTCTCVYARYVSVDACWRILETCPRPIPIPSTGRCAAENGRADLSRMARDSRAKIDQLKPRVERLRRKEKVLELSSTYSMQDAKHRMHPATNDTPYIRPSQSALTIGQTTPAQQTRTREQKAIRPPQPNPHDTLNSKVLVGTQGLKLQPV